MTDSEFAEVLSKRDPSGRLGTIWQDIGKNHLWPDQVFKQVVPMLFGPVVRVFVFCAMLIGFFTIVSDRPWVVLLICCAGLAISGLFCAGIAVYLWLLVRKELGWASQYKEDFRMQLLEALDRRQSEGETGANPAN